MTFNEAKAAWLAIPPADQRAVLVSMEQVKSARMKPAVEAAQALLRAMGSGRGVHESGGGA